MRSKTKKSRKKEPLQVKRLSLGRLRRWFLSSRWKFYTVLSVCSIFVFTILWFTLHPLYWMNVLYGVCEESFVNLTGHMGFRVKDVFIQGRQNIPLQVVSNAVNMQIKQPIFSRSPSDIQQQLEQVPWIHKAHVKRVLPDRVFIKIQERYPVALWQNKGLYHLLDRTGYVIENTNLQPFTRLPIVVGENAPQKIGHFLEIIKKFPLVEKQMTGMIYISGRRWNIQLDRKAIVKLAEKGEEQGLKRLVTILTNKKIDLSDIEVIDLRIPQHYILKLKPAAKIRVTKKAAVA